MRFNQLLELQLTESRNILKESCEGLNLQQRKIVEGIVSEFKPLIEASLTADQITQIFSNVEKSATDAGSNRTALGKGVDVTKKANEVINNVGKWLQNTTPVKMADEKFEKLKNDINKKFPDSKLLDGISNLGIWMKENPGKSAAVIGVLTALASLAGGPVGGAIAGQVLRGAAELIKGEKLSTAVGKGIKTAALGYLSGKAFEMLGNWMAGFREQSIPFGPADAGLERVSWGATNKITAPGMEWTRTTQGFDALVRPEEAEVIRTAMAGVKAGDSGAFDSLLTVAREVNSKDYKAGLDGIVQGAWKAAKDNDSLLQFINTAKEGLQAGAQGAVAASTGTEKKESYYVQTRPLSEGQVYMVFNRVATLNEGPMWDKVKGAAGKAVGAVAQKAGQIGTNLTTKVTADKLNSAWKKAGSPMDSNAVADILKQSGVDDQIVGKVYTDLKLPAPGSSSDTDPTAKPEETPAAAAKAETVYSQVKASVSKMNKKERQRLLAYMQKLMSAA